VPAGHNQPALLRRAAIAAWPLRDGRLPLRGSRCEAPRLAQGLKGRSATPLCTPGRPQDHHHQTLASAPPGYGVATKPLPCALVAFVAVQATHPLRPPGRGLSTAVPVVIKGEPTPARRQVPGRMRDVRAEVRARPKPAIHPVVHHPQQALQDAQSCAAFLTPIERQRNHLAVSTACALDCGRGNRTLPRATKAHGRDFVATTSQCGLAEHA